MFYIVAPRAAFNPEMCVYRVPLSGRENRGVVSPCCLQGTQAGMGAACTCAVGRRGEGIFLKK